MERLSDKLLKIDLGRMVVVSNRLPIGIKKDNDDNWTIKAGSGGLVTALSPIIKERKGLWIGWSGTAEEDNAPLEQLFDKQAVESGYNMRGVPLSQEEIHGFYQGFSNQVLWPLFHDLLGRCNFDPAFWDVYIRSNQRFANVLEKTVQPDDFLWIHDYHLIPLGDMVRHFGYEGKLAFFLHIPFPPLDIYRRLPWRMELLKNLLAYNVTGFQTRRDYNNFIRAVRHFIPEAQVMLQQNHAVIFYQGRRILCQAFPISIDYQSFNELAKSDRVRDEAWFMHEKYPDQKIYLGVDRLDYTKGIAYRFMAFRRALRKYPELREKVTLVQLVVPSRVEVHEYQSLKAQLDNLVGEIIGEFARPGWIPIHYYFRRMDRQKLVALYRASEVAYITPVRDGMNLVAKEYCASQQGGGVLILSEFAGAADQLKGGAILINPYDLDGTADAVYEAFKMPQEEREKRMGIMRQAVRRNNVNHWLNRFLNAAKAHSDAEEPVVEA